MISSKYLNRWKVDSMTLTTSFVTKSTKICTFKKTAYLGLCFGLLCKINIKWRLKCRLSKLPRPWRFQKYIVLWMFDEKRLSYVSVKIRKNWIFSKSFFDMAVAYLQGMCGIRDRSIVFDFKIDACRNVLEVI